MRRVFNRDALKAAGKSPQRTVFPRTWRLVFVAIMSVLMLGASGASSASQHDGRHLRIHRTAHTNVKAAQALINKFQKTVPFQSPGPSLKTASLKGKTVWYVPNLYGVPPIPVIYNTLKSSFAHAGMKLDLCDGKGNPVNFASCVSQAVAQRAAGVIIDSIPSSLIKTQLAAAQAAHVKIVMANDSEPGMALPANVNARVAYDYVVAGQLEAASIIAASHGKANILLIQATDLSPNTPLVDGGILPTLHKWCPNCKVTVKDEPVTNWATGTGPLAMAALTADPSIHYIIAAFDSMVPDMIAPLTQAHYSGKVDIATFNGSLLAMQYLKNHQFVISNVGSDAPYEAWADTDAMLRALLGNPRGNDLVPTRIFTSKNIGSVRLTTAGSTTGEWFGSKSYTSHFLKIWGL